MKKLIILFCLTLFFLIVSCSDNKKNDLREYINKELEHYSINADTKVEKEGGVFIIDLKYKKPYKLVDYDFQDVFMSYLAYNIYSKFDLQEETKLISYLDKEEVFNRREVIYDFRKVDKLGFRDNPLFLDLLNYSFGRFNKVDPISIDESILLMNDMFPEITEKENVFELLLKFSKNTNKPTLDNKSDAIMVLMYFYYKDMSNEVADVQYKEKSKRVSRILADMWKVVKKTEIEKQSDYFSQLLVKTHLNKEEVIYNEN